MGVVIRPFVTCFDGDGKAGLGICIFQVWILLELLGRSHQSFCSRTDAAPLPWQASYLSLSSVEFLLRSAVDSAATPEK